MTRRRWKLTMARRKPAARDFRFATLPLPTTFTISRDSRRALADGEYSSANTAADAKMMIIA